MAMKTPVHPSEILREDVLAEIGLGVGEAATRLGISRVALSRVLHGHAHTTPNLAVRLEQTGDGTARAWLAMQTAHDLAAELATGPHKVRPLNDVAWPSTGAPSPRESPTVGHGHIAPRMWAAALAVEETKGSARQRVELGIRCHEHPWLTGVDRGDVPKNGVSQTLVTPGVQQVVAMAHPG